MAGFSNYAEAKILDHILGTTSYTFNSNMYLGLFTAAPTDAGGGTEASYTGYSRQNIFGKFGTAAGTPRSKTNTVPIVFAANESNAATTITHVGLFDANSSGNLIIWAALSVSRTVQIGQRPQFAVSTLTFTQD